MHRRSKMTQPKAYEALKNHNFTTEEGLIQIVDAFDMFGIFELKDEIDAADKRHDYLDGLDQLRDDDAVDEAWQDYLDLKSDMKHRFFDGVLFAPEALAQTIDLMLENFGVVYESDFEASQEQGLKLLRNAVATMNLAAYTPSQSISDSQATMLVDNIVKYNLADEEGLELYEPVVVYEELGKVTYTQRRTDFSPEAERKRRGLHMRPVIKTLKEVEAHKLKIRLTPVKSISLRFYYREEDITIIDFNLDPVSSLLGYDQMLIDELAKKAKQESKTELVYQSSHNKDAERWFDGLGFSFLTGALIDPIATARYKVE